MHSPAVSVVVPVYREGHVLAEAIDSVLAQTFSDYEVILVDNNASQSTRDIANHYAEKHPERVRIVRQPIQGCSAARNKGIEESRGVYVALLDGDDIWKPERLERQFEIMSRRDDIALVSSAFDKIDWDTGALVVSGDQGPIAGFLKDMEKEVVRFFPKRLQSGDASTFHFPASSSVLFRRSDAVTIGLFDNRFNPRYFQEVEFFTRLFEVGAFHKVPESLVLYRKNSETVRRKKGFDLSLFLLQAMRFVQVLEERYRGVIPDSGAVLSRIFALSLCNAGLELVRDAGGTKSARTVFLTAIRRDPTNEFYWKLWLKTYLPQAFFPKLFWFDTFYKDPIPFEAESEPVRSVLGWIPLPPK